MTDVRPPVTLGLLGCGRIAQAAHLPAIDKAAGVRLAAVCDPSSLLAEGVGERYGVQAFTDADEMLRTDLDAVLIAVPDRLHLRLGLEALGRGKHVLMEKPLAATAAEAQQLVTAAAAADLRLQTGSMKRHDPALEFARCNMPRLGRVLSMATWYRVMSATRAAVQDTLFPPMIVDRRVRETENRVKADTERYRLVTHGAHVFDTMRYLVGDLEWLTTRKAWVDNDITWHGSAGIARGGGIASFEISVNVHSQWGEGADIFGERGHIKIRSPYVFSRLGSHVELFLEEQAAAAIPRFADTNPFKRQIEAFARAIVERSPTNPSPEDGAEALRLIEAAAASAADGGRTVALR